MGLYVGVNAALIGLFGFAAIYHLVLWWQSRRDWILLLFAVHCTQCAIFSADIIALVRKVRARVKDARGIDLEPEVMLYGREWKDVL